MPVKATKGVILLSITLLSSLFIYFIKSNIKPFYLTDLVDKNDPVVRELKIHQKIYNNKNYITLAVKWKNRFNSHNDFKLLKKLHERIEQRVPTAKVQSLNDILLPHFNKSGSLTFVEVRKKIEELNNLLLKPFIIQSNNNILIFNIYTKNDKEILRLNNLVKEFTSQGFPSYLIGSDYFQTFVRKETISDQKLIVPIVLIIIFLLFAFIFQSWRVSIVSLVIISLSYLLTLTFIIYIEGKITPFGNLALMISLVMGISDLVHLLFHWPKKNWAYPCFLTSLVTGIGLLALFLSEIKSVSNFGLFCFIAVAFSYLLTLLLAPLIIKTWNIEITPRRNMFLIDNFYDGIKRYKGQIVIIFFFIIVFPLFFLNDLRINENYLKQFISTHDFSKNVKFFTDKLRNTGSIDLVINIERKKMLSSKIHDFELKVINYLKQDPLVANIYSLTNIKQYFKEKNELTKKNISILDQLNFFDIFSPKLMDESRWIITINNHNTENIEKFIERSTEQLKSIESLKGKEIKFLGYSVSRTIIMSNLKKVYIKSFLFTLIGVFICFLIFLRSIPLSLLAMIPNILPVTFIISLHSLFNISFNFFLVILSCLILSISVNDTIHFFYYYMRDKSIKKALILTSSPIIMTTIFINILFLSFFLSKFRSFHQVALFAIIAFTMAVLSDLILLPAILQYFKKTKVKYV